MAYIGINFTDEELNAEVPGGDFTPLPAGDYDVQIVKSEVKTTKAGDGQYINLQLEVEGPTSIGRVVFAMLNIQNPSPKAEAIGRSQLGSILRVMNIPAHTFEDSDQLLGGELTVTLSVKAASGDYKAGNEVKAYKPRGGNQVTTQRPQINTQKSTAPTPVQQPAQISKAAPPWAKK